ncbi:MAG: SelB C-terminal domain-containing protein, partial [Planctomycetota bacterium]|nr:SelB C-terminal domain-containing protein [Planctomycetota bacterium]
PEVHFYERGGRAYLREIVESGRAELFQSVERMLRNKPLAASIKRAALRPSRDLPLDLQKVVLDELQKEGRVRTRSGGRVLFLDRLTPLSAGDQKLLDRLVGTCEEVGFRPLTADELREKLAMSEADYTSLFARAEDEGMVDSVGDHIYGSTVIRKALVAIRNDCLRHDGELNIPELRDELGTSRKYLIPLLEYVDGLGLTQLRSGVRRLISTSELNEELSGSE